MPINSFAVNHESSYKINNDDIYEIRIRLYNNVNNNKTYHTNQISCMPQKYLYETTKYLIKGKITKGIKQLYTSRQMRKTDNE